MKRKAADNDEVLQASKKARTEYPVASSLAPGPGPGPGHDLDYVSDGDEDSSDQESRSAATLASTQPTNTPSTPQSPWRKFPSELKTIKCSYEGCHKSFNRPARLAAHMRSHTNDRPFKCTYEGCDKSYIEEKHLKQHIKGSHTAERSYTCTVEGCGKSFLTATRLRRHQAVHEGQERYRCRDFPPCNQSFRKHQTLQRHIRSEHLHVAAYHCAYKDPDTGAPCGAGFDTAATLKRHEEREHGDLRFWCDECIRHLDENGNPKRTGFPTARLLQTHIKEVHANCMFCGLSCHGRAALDKHIEEQHSKQSLDERKTVPCTFEGCTKTFTKKSNMYAHIRAVHEGLRFVCGEIDLSGTEDLATWPRSQGCGEGFATKASLENHVRYIHLGHKRPQGPGTASTSDQQGGLTLLQELTGIGTKSRRTVSCLISGCTQKFFHVSEREEHIQSQHSVEQALLTNLGAEAMLLGGAPSPEAGVEKQAPLGGADELQGLLNWDENDESANSRNAENDIFWYELDAGPAQQQQQVVLDDERLQDNDRLERLDAIGDTLESLIDPALG